MTETPKTSIGGYAISRRLPGPGESYQARSPSGDRVLLRVLPRPADDQAWDQLKQDVAACRRLDHPAIAKPTDVFEDGPTLVLVDEYFEGSKLGQLMKRPISRTKLQGPAAWHIAHQLTGALAQAHAAVDDAGVPAGVCHGHLSPAEILVSVEGDVRIEGLGLAALAGTADAPVVPAFQAPEEAKGGKVTPRGDLYSAAVILWALVTGTEPPAAGTRVELATIEPLVSPAVLAVLRLALEPSLGKRKITTMEVEEAIKESFDRAEGKQAAAAAARALAQSGRTLVGTGGLAAGLASPGRADAGVTAVAGAPERVPSVPSATPAAPPVAAAAGGATSGSAVLGPGMKRGPAGPAAPAEPVSPTVGADAPLIAATGGLQGIEPKARASVGGPKKGLRQATLLGSWMNQPAQATKPTGGPAAPKVSGAPIAESSRSDARPPSPRPTGVETARPAAPETGAPAPRAAAPGAGATREERGTVEPDDSLDLEAAMLGATVTADSTSERSAPPPAPDRPAASAVAPDAGGTSSVATVPLPRPRRDAPAAMAEPVAPSPSSGVALALSDALLPDAPAAPTDPALGGTDVEATSNAAPATAAAAQATAPGPVGSPWSPGGAAGQGAAVGAKPLSWGAAIVIAVITAVLTMAVGIWWTRRQVGLVEVTPPEPATAPSSPTASATAASASASSAAPGPAPDASGSPAASAGSSATADAGPDLAGGDGKNLPADRGLLRVTFSPAEGAEVFIYGKSAGPVGQSLEVACGRRFVRVGKMPGPTWLSKGESVEIACQSVTSITLAAQ